MKQICLSFLVVFIVLPGVTGAAVSNADIPDSAVWYVHANLEAMRDSDAGAAIYRWFEDEVADEVKEELGVDISAEVNAITAFSDNDSGVVMVVDGPLSERTVEKLLALAVLQQSVDERIHEGKKYYFVSADEATQDEAEKSDDKKHHRHETGLHVLQDSAYLSFDFDNRAIIASNEAQMYTLLENGGNVAGVGSGSNGTMFVISAEKSFVQASVRTDEFAGNGGDGWESNILRNTEQAALLVADADGKIAVEAQLVSTDANMASAIAGIINGLIGLQTFNAELGPDIQDIIRSTKVAVDEKTLSVSLVVDPDVVVSVLEN